MSIIIGRALLKSYINQIYADMLQNNNMILKSPVNDEADIAIAYPNPEVGWTVRVTSNSKVFRYDGQSWVWIDTLNVSAYDALLSLLNSITAIIGTAKTTAIANTASLTAQGDETNIGLAIQPKGTGALTVRVPDDAITGGNARGAYAVDLQCARAFSDQVAGAPYSFIAGGRSNKIKSITERGSDAKESHAEGYNNRVFDWYGHAEGANCIVDGKISHTEGNTVICSANDSHAEGNRNVAGRKYFSGVTFGEEDAGDNLGALQYVLIPNTEGDVSSYFPNALTNNVTTRYGAGAQIDAKGNIYPSGMTPAVWNGDVLVTANDLLWALHPICIVRGPSEPNIEFVNIAKAAYSAGTGTKVYYRGDRPFATLIGIYSSYAPTVVVDGLQGGNGNHAEGLFTSTYGYGAHAEGSYTRAWGKYAHAEGHATQATGEAAHAEGRDNIASGLYSHAEGRLTRASGEASHAEGRENIASGYASHAEGYLNTASGDYSRAEGRENIASGMYSSVKGRYGKATRSYQNSYAVGRITADGDNQLIEISYTHSCAGVGWWVIKILDACEDGKAYNFETMVLGRQKAGAAGTIGDTFAYKFTGCFVRSGATFTVLGTPTRTLIGRSATMDGDGLTTGVRVAWSALFTNNGAHLRMDGLADTTFVVTTYNVIQEMGL